MERKSTTGVDNHKRIVILHGVLVLVIILCFMVTPVMGVIKTENWTPLGPLPPNFLPDQFKPSEPVPVPEYANLTPTEKKIEPDLRDLVAAQKMSIGVKNVNIANIKKNKQLYKPGNVSTINGLSIQTSPDLVFLEIFVFPGNSTHVLDPYIYELNARGEEWRSLSAWVDVTKIYDIASLAEVSAIRIVTPAVYSTGSQTTQGNETLHVKDLLNLPNGPKGDGIKIGVISDGMSHRSAAVSSKDLPSPPFDVKVGNEGTGDEGTALMEIIYDLVPNASLFFYAANNVDSFRNAVNYLEGTMGCNIICDDTKIFYEPAFEDGAVAQLIDSHSSSTLFVTAAGNHGDQHYQGLFVPQQSNNLSHDFRFRTGSYPPLYSDPAYPYLYATLKQGKSLSIYLQWDDPWDNSTNDYNLYLRNATTGDLLGLSNLPQTGASDQPPYEKILGYTADTDMVVRIEVEKLNSAVQDRTLEIWFEVSDYPSIEPNNIIPNDSVFGPSAARQVITTAASDYNHTEGIEPYSSQGPVTIRYPEYEQRTKPDITAVDQVYVSGAGGFPQVFRGTSAAAPHIAGIAALLWSKDPSKTSTEIKNAILNNADHRGDNNTFGSGLANALKAYYALYPGPTLTGIIPNTGINTTLINITSLSGTNFEPNSSVYLTKTGFSTIYATNVSAVSSSLITCSINITGATAGPWNVTVQNPDGQFGNLTNGFNVTSSSLAITSITPSTGINTGPVTITNLSGTSFEPNASVSLSRTGQSTINATSVSVASSSLITCSINITGVAPGPWNVTVQNPDGQSGTLVNGFYVNSSASLSVTSITPSSGLSTGSVSITNLSGENFNTSATVNLTRTGQPNITATSVQVLSPSQITCTLPLTGKSAGQWNIGVTNPDGQSGTLANGFTVTAPGPGNTPFVIDPSLMNTFNGQYLSSRGYGWCDFGGVNNSYYKITLAGNQQYPTEFHLKNSFTTKAQFGILLQASNVRISGVDLSTAPNADQRPVNTITNTYAPLTLAETGAAGIKVKPGFTGIKLVNVNVNAANVPALHVDGSDVEIIGTNNPDPYLTTYAGNGLNDAWGTTLTGKLNSAYGLGLLQQTTTHSSAVTITGDGGAGVNMTGPFSGIELDGKTASLAINGNNIHINGTGTDSGTGSDRNAGISAWGGSSVTMAATDSSITGQEYGIYGQGGAIISVSCPGCTIDPIVNGSTVRTYREMASAQRSGSMIRGGLHGLFLTGASSSGLGKVTIANVTVQGQSGYGVDLNQATGYNISITNPSAIIGSLGKFGSTGSTSNQINVGSVVIQTGSNGTYPVNIALDSIPGPNPYNLKIFSESGSLVYDINDWSLLPAGVTYNSANRTVSFESATLQVYSAVKYTSSGSTLTVTGIEPASGLQGRTIRITNLSGLFNTTASGTEVLLSRSGTNISATGVIVASSNLITGNFSLPSDAEPGSWQVAVQQDGQWSRGNVTFTILKEISLPQVTTLPADNVTAGSARLMANLTNTGGEPCSVFFGYGRGPSGLSANSSLITLPGPGLGNVTISGLTPDTTWYYAAYANNSAGIMQGAVLNFTTRSDHSVPKISGISPSSGTRGTIVQVTNLSGVFNTTASDTGMVLSRSGTNISAGNVSVVSADLITGNFSLPPQAEPGSWQVAVQQDGWWSSENVTFTIDQGGYIVNATSSSGGVISPSGLVPVSSGSNQSFTMTADPGYHVGDVVVDNSSVGAVGSYTFSLVTSNHTISAEFMANDTPHYAIVANCTTGGIISPSGPVMVSSGSNQSFTMTASPGYHLGDVLVDNSSVGAVSSYTFSSVISNHTIFAEFMANGTVSYTISASSSAGGIISPSGLVPVSSGSNQSFTMTADPGYHVEDVVVDNSSVGAVSSYTFSSVTSNHTISAGFMANGTVSYTISASSSTGGIITPSGLVTVSSGSSQNFTMTASPGYHVGDVLVDNSSVGAVSSYTFSSVTSNHRIDAIFDPSLRPPVISGVSPDSGRQNSTVTLFIAGQNFYGQERIDLVRTGAANLTRAGRLAGDKLVGTDLNLTAPVGSWDLWVTNLTTGLSAMKKDAFTITEGQKKFYTITTKADQYGSITPSGQVQVKAGSQKQFTMHTIRGAEIVNVTVDGAPVNLSHNNEYTFVNVTADHTLALNTRLIQNVVTANFTVDKTSGQVPLKVRFTDTSSGSPTRWLWNFGDWTVSTLQNPVHTYTWPGQYTVTLVARNGKNTDTIVRKKLIRVTGGKGSSLLSGGNEEVISAPAPGFSGTDASSAVILDRSVLPGRNILAGSQVPERQNPISFVG